MSAGAAAYLPTLSDFKATFGAGLIGSWIMATLYGVACAQYTKDSLWLKSLVVAMWAFDTIHAATTYAFGYYYLISSAFDPLAAARNLWYQSASIASRVFITIFFFTYFTQLTFRLSGPRSRYIITPILLALTCVHIVFACIVVARIGRAKYLAEFANFRTPMISMAVSQVAVDLVLSGILCVLLNKHKSSFKRTNTMINTLIVFAVSRGILTAIAASVEFLAIAINPRTLWYSAAEYIIGGLYTNSFLLTLNARNSVRTLGEPSNHPSFMLPLSRFVARSGPTGESTDYSTSSTEAQRSDIKGEVKAEDKVEPPTFDIRASVVEVPAEGRPSV